MEYRIITREEWGALPPKQALTKWGAVLGWVQHWAGVYHDPDTADFTADIRQEQQYHQTKANDILYNFLVCPNGQIFEGRGWNYRSGANGNTHWNQYGFAVQYHGGPNKDRTLETPLTEAGQGALRWLYQQALVRYPLLVEVYGHRDVRDSYTECPGDVLMDWLPTIGEPEDGDTDMPLTAEDKTWIRSAIKEEVTKLIGPAPSGVEKNIHETVKLAVKRTVADNCLK